MIKVVFFDAEGTFIRFKPSLNGIYKSLWDSYGINLDGDDWGARLRSAYKIVFQKRLSPPLNGELCKRAWREVFDLVFGDFKIFPFYEEVFQRAYKLFAAPECVEVMPGFTDFLKSVKEREFKTAVISNWDCRLYSVLEGHKLLQEFEALFLGCEVGYLKPHEAIFKRALNYFGISPEQALMVGDSLEDDIIPAQKIGMKTYYIKGEPNYQEIWEILVN